MSSHAGRLVSLCLPLVLTALALLAPAASADPSFCPVGSGAGQCDKPGAVAVDPVSGNVYVTDRGNDRVNVFDEGGGFLFAFGWGVADGTTNAPQTCTTTCFKGIAGAGNGQFNEPRSIAVDRDPASSSYRDVYVFDGLNFRVQKFDPTGNFMLTFGSQGSGSGQFRAVGSSIAIGADGTVYVSDCEFIPPGTSNKCRIEKFSPAGSFLGAAQLADGLLVTSLAIDAAGRAYVARGSLEAYELSEPAATKLGEVPPSNVTVVAVNPADASSPIYSSQANSQVKGGPWVIVEYDSTLAERRRFGYGEVDLQLQGLAIAKGGGALYGSGGEFEANRVVTIPVLPPGPLACCIEVDPDAVKATLEGGVNPEGKATTYRFEYVEEAIYEADIVAEGAGHGFDHATSTPESAPIGPDFTLYTASVQVGCQNPAEVPPPTDCLTPDTNYRFRLIATNADGKSEAEGQFATTPPLEILETFATEVGTDAARLHTTVNPSGIPTTGYFEYVDDAAFKASGFTAAARIPAAGDAPLDFGSAAPQTRVAQLSGLAPGTTYHYRLLATDPLLAAPIVGEERTFTTFPLPVPPANACPNASFRIGASANLPECRAYEMVSPLDKGGADIAVLQTFIPYPAGLEQSSSGGSRLSYSSATAFGGALSAPWTSQYLAGRDPEAGWSTEAISPPRESPSYTSDTATWGDVQFKSFSAELSNGWLLHDTAPLLDPCGVPGYLNLYRRSLDGSYEAITTAKPFAPQDANGYLPEIEGHSSDDTHVVFRANARLFASASNAGGSTPINQLYEHVDNGKGCGVLRLVSVLPDGKANAASSSVGTANFLFRRNRFQTVSRAVSADGSRIVWSVPPSAQNGVGPGALYIRIDGKETLEISPGPARFWTASTDGSKVFYTLGDTVKGEGELYEYNVEKALGGEAAQTLIANEVQGVADASEDGSRLYFVSGEVSGGEGEAGKPNLYLRESGVGSRLVGTLGVGDVDRGQFNDSSGFINSPFSIASLDPTHRGTRLTPDGAHLAFVSTAQLTGYDNADAADGRPALELFLYDAADGHLTCVSCNPSGARPAARDILGASNSSLPVAAQMAPAETQDYVPRSLSTDGNRLFFESFEALVPRDTNGKEDVYEWQRAADGKACEEAGAELHVPASGGCLSLISSGKSPADSVFVDASADGSDVFIKTSSSLLPQDPGLIDIYDARIGGGFPAPPVNPPGCEGEACQGTPSPPDDPTPGSSSFEGAGNVATEKPASCRKPKVRRKGHCVAKQRKHARKGQRADHKRRAGR